MKILFTFDMKDYDDTMPIIERVGVRAIIYRNGLFLMQKSKDGDYKIPGGGKETDETPVQTLIREVSEETGYEVKADTIREIGEVQEIRRDSFNPQYKYIAHSYFYFCDVSDEACDTRMTENELKKGYEPVWEHIDVIIDTNHKVQKEMWTIRDTRFLEWLRDNNEQMGE